MIRIILVAFCLTVLVGCTGRRGESATAYSPTAVPMHVGREDVRGRQIRLTLSDYGRRLFERPEQDWAALMLYTESPVPDLRWMCHFDPLLEAKAEAAEYAEKLHMNKQEARAALIRYVTEKIYPVRASLKVVRAGRRFLLGEYIDTRIRSFAVGRYGGDIGLIYKRDF